MGGTYGDEGRGSLVSGGASCDIKTNLCMVYATIKYALIVLLLGIRLDFQPQNYVCRVIRERKRTEKENIT